MSCAFFDANPESKPDWKAYVLRELVKTRTARRKRILATCSNCHEEVATLRLTLDTLSTLREEEMPRRIAFVSDKVFEPRWWQRVFNPTFAAGAWWRPRSWCTALCGPARLKWSRRKPRWMPHVTKRASRKWKRGMRRKSR